MILSLLIIPYMAFVYRWKGMAHSWDDTVNRLTYGALTGLPCAWICYLWDFPLWLALPCAITAFVSAIIGHASEQSTTWPEHLKMGFITTLMLAMTLVPFSIYNYFMHNVFGIFLYILPLGYLGSIAYWLGYKYQFNMGIWTQTGNNTSMSELYCGALAFGLPLAIIGLMHH